MQNKVNELKRRLAEVIDINHAASVLNWDQQTYMPPGGAKARAQQIATLSHLAHEKFIDYGVGNLLEELKAYAESLPYDSDETSLIRVIQRDYDKALKIPGSLVSEIAQAAAHAFDAWRKAKEKSRFPDFAPYLKRNLELKKRYAECLGYTDRIYDPLLDEYEPAMKTSQIDTIFTQIKQEVVPLVKAITPKLNSVDDSFLYQEFDERKQWELSIEIAKTLGYVFERGRQDLAPHPFTTSFSIDDVRITTRIMQNYFSAGFFATIHETGHALYSQGIRHELERTPLGGGASLGVHESQSRLWENMIARSRSFWKFYLQHVQSLFPEQFKNINTDMMYRAVNCVKPSFIRVEADEITYNLHILLRFELENALLEDRITIEDLPDAWNTKMQEYLGITPPNDAQGVLQDVHWSYGSFGYFPTYTLGNILAAQVFDTIVKDIPDIQTHFETGDFQPLLFWLQTNLHTHGRKFTIEELAKKITGEPLQTRSYISYLKNKVHDIYNA